MLAPLLPRPKVLRRADVWLLLALGPILEQNQVELSTKNFSYFCLMATNRLELPAEPPPKVKQVLVVVALVVPAGVQDASGDSRLLVSTV